MCPFFSNGRVIIYLIDGRDTYIRLFESGYAVSGCTANLNGGQKLVGRKDAISGGEKLLGFLREVGRIRLALEGF